MIEDSRLKIRLIDNSEFLYLEQFLYEAIFIPEGAAKLDFNIIYRPELAVYFKDFGRNDDICFVAEQDGKLVGAIWTRIFDDTERGYGYVDSNTPELCMSVLTDYRQKGIGTILLKTILDKLSQNNYQQVSLSVDKINYAVKLYKRFGFNELFTVGESVTMIKKLKE